MGGNKINTVSMLRFKDFLHNCDLIDLGYSGQSFTWSNRRSQHIRERIDKAYGQPS